MPLRARIPCPASSCQPSCTYTNLSESELITRENLCYRYIWIHMIMHMAEDNLCDGQRRVVDSGALHINATNSYQRCTHVASMHNSLKIAFCRSKNRSSSDYIYNEWTFLTIPSHTAHINTYYHMHTCRMLHHTCPPLRIHPPTSMRFSGHLTHTCMTTRTPHAHNAPCDDAYDSWGPGPPRLYIYPHPNAHDPLSIQHVCVHDHA